MRAASFFLVLFLVLAAGVSAQGITVAIDRPEATIQDQLTLKVTIEGSQRATPRLPDLPAFEVLTGGQQSQFQMINGRTTVSITHNFHLRPKQVGTFTIGPASVEIDGRTYRSPPFRVRILEATATPQESEAVFITARVSNENPYVGEQVTYTWRFYRRVQVNDPQLAPLEFEGFLVENLGDEVREYRTTRNGQQYLVSEIRRALFPQEVGKIVLPATQLRCNVLVRTRARSRSAFDDFFGRQRAEPKLLRSPAIEVNVRPRPAAPGGFSGLVGDFKISSQLPKRDLQVGESATWKLTISGSGNVQMIGEPKLPDLDRFKIYDDKPTSSVDRSGTQLRGSRTYTKALVPLEAGELRVPAIHLTYFDPKAGTYRTASTGPILLAVGAAEGKEELRLTESVAPTTGKVSVRILADDILPVYKDLDAVASMPFGHRADLSFFAGLLAPPLLFFGLLFVEQRRRHFEVNVHLVRRRVALKKALKGLDEVDATARRGEHREAAQLASRVLRQYVGDKVALEGSAFTPAEADTQLRQSGVEDDVVRTTHEQLEALEAAQYAGIGAEKSEHLAEELRPLLKELERQIRV